MALQEKEVEEEKSENEAFGNSLFPLLLRPGWLASSN